MPSIMGSIARSKPPPPGSLRLRAFHAFTRAHARLYRATGGKFIGKWLGAPLLILHHVGRKSGTDRRSPLIYTKDGNDFVVVASMGGSSAHPAWYLNIEAQPETTIDVEGKTIAVRARTATTEEKARLWPRVVETYDGYSTYQERTTRDLPVVILEPPV